MSEGEGESFEFSEDTVFEHEEVTQPPLPQGMLSPDDDLADKIKRGLVVSKMIDAISKPGLKLETVEAGTLMSKNDFFAYKEKLKQCKPRFHFDKEGLKTGNENTWYRELEKKGKDKQEPPQKRAKIEKEERTKGRARKRRTEAPPPPRPKQAKLEDQTGPLEGDLARNIQVEGLLPADVKRIIRALRSTRCADNTLKSIALDIYEQSYQLNIFKTVTISITSDGNAEVSILRPSFDDLWVTEDPPEFERSFIRYTTQVLMHYSRSSDPRTHAEICACWLWGKSDWMARELSEVDLRDFIIHSLGDLFVTVEGDDAISIWWQNSWTLSKGSFHRLGHMIMEAVRELYTIRQHEIWRLHVMDWIAKDEQRECLIDQHRPDPLDALLHSLAKDKRGWFRNEKDIAILVQLCKVILMDMAKETGVGELINDDTGFSWVTPGENGCVKWTAHWIKRLIEESETLLNDEGMMKLLSDHTSSSNAHVRQLVVEQLQAYSLPTDPFDRKHHLFCFTNATFDLHLGTFVPISKFDFCQMNCGRPWIEPTDTQRKKVAALMESIFPREEIRCCSISVLKSGLSGDRPEHFVVDNGGGRNGKGVKNEMMSYTVGNYGAEGHLALLTKPIKDGPNPEAANLHRKRWVVWSEPEDGYNEALRLSCIKKLTGCPILNARGCHSNKTEVELNATTLMECNKQPPITGEKGEAALQRVRLIPFEVTFTDDKEKLAANPEKYKPKDDSLKTPGFKEEHRCAFFEYVVANGGDAPYFPEETKALGAKYLTENDDLSLWILDKYEQTKPTTPVKNFVSIKVMYEKYMDSMYHLMSKAEKRRVTQTAFKETVQKNLLLKDFFVEAKKFKNAAGKYNTKEGIIHLRVKPEETDDDGFDNGIMPSGFVTGVPVQTTLERDGNGW